MAFDRTAMIAYLTQQFSPLEAKTGVTADDTSPQGYKDVLDDVLLLKGVDYTDLGTASFTSNQDVQDARVLLRYYALVRFANKLSSTLSYNINGAGVTENKGNLLDQVLTLLNRAEQEARARGYNVGEGVTGGSTSPLAYTLDLGIYQTANEGI